ncbi:heterodisulfide reductase-related iron-sulfur binding cluster [Inmirania thermothiophila]|uniref:Fe-S oxidoreductase n=1 Tax=Inmirania thermothiophila TaxID=1750597 RepID=A0A3N1XTZ1_9GAMM|nr:heterodisulfide reductase-related iron-sulfur binding cluster [Inmirania thermothiophila]ROR29728.1 Fe-S oxidoreductase [Inmirania thermothiophila]
MAEETERRGRVEEGGTRAPQRRPLAWRDPAFHDEEALLAEMARVFEVCHGCRRCFSLCNAFPTLFDAIDAGESGEPEDLPREVYWQVAEHCYLCDLCFQTKCPYVPPHPFDIDFPHLMLRAKAVRLRQGRVRLRDRILTATDAVGRLAGIPVVVEAVNRANRSPLARALMERVLGVHRDAALPPYRARPLRRRLAADAEDAEARPAGRTRGRVVLFATCYGNRNEPEIGEDLAAVFRHNGIPVTLTRRERCCGMPRMELGDLEEVVRLAEINLPQLLPLVEAGWDVVAPVPSCVLLFRRELPLLLPGDERVARVAQAFFDPFEYLWLRHREGLLRTDFRNPLGRIAYHVPCHLRVQNIGLKTRDVLALVPGTEIEVIERCSGHDGTYAVKREYHETSMRIGRPVFERVRRARAEHYASDCPMAGRQIGSGLGDGSSPVHPMTLLRRAYGI